MAKSSVPAATSIKSHGLSSELAVTLDNQIEGLNLSGIGSDGQWSHTMTRRAAHALWYRLTWELFPEKSSRVTGMAATAPLRLSNDEQAVTHIELIHQAQLQPLTVVGWNTAARWRFDLDDHNARQLWAALDVALYPAGWVGASTTYKKG